MRKTRDQLAAALEEARAEAAHKLEAQRARIERELTALGHPIKWQASELEAALLRELAPAQAAFDAAIADNAHHIAAWSLRELTAAAKVCRGHGGRAAAEAFIRKLCQVGSQKLELTGRPLDAGLAGNEAFLGFAASFIADAPGALVAFADPRALTVTFGTPQAVDLVLAATRNPEDAGGALLAVEALERACRRIAASAAGAVTDDAKRRWEILTSGATASEQEGMRAALGREQQARSVAEWEERRAFARRVRSGDPEARKGISAKELESIIKLDETIFGPVHPSLLRKGAWGQSH
jgi:hypothetical protein